ncbi:MAG: dTMP kinase [Ferrimicrobium acidiphilum]|uniref:dTMP kinase n=1 Tax=Ferrimicrobium acidiphilum TaxID=121039 RepID=UPI0023F12B78|nr:dTMP kinase [Ferrimicrobium acidiphilum]
MSARRNLTTTVDRYRRGALVVLEGPDRVGKSTQVEQLAHLLRQRGRSVLVSREPGGDALGEAIRTMVLASHLHPWTEIFLFLAGRARHLDEVIEPALAHGELVLLDRYTPSTLVYQGAELGDEVVAELCSLPVFRTPELTIILDRELPLAELEASDRFESTGLAGWQVRRSRYLSFSHRFGWTTVSGEGSEEEVVLRLLDVLTAAGIIE